MLPFATSEPPEAALAALTGASAPLTDPVAAWEALDVALALAPGDLQVQLAAYRMCFYAHRYYQAVDHAEALLAMAARRLNVSADWHDIRPKDAPFTDQSFAPGLYLQALIACGYCLLRLGQVEDGEARLRHALVLDPTDRFGATILLRALEVAEEDA